MLSVVGLDHFQETNARVILFLVYFLNCLATYLRLLFANNNLYRTMK